MKMTILFLLALSIQIAHADQLFIETDKGDVEVPRNEFVTPISKSVSACDFKVDEHYLWIVYYFANTSNGAAYKESLVNENRQSSSVSENKDRAQVISILSYAQLQKGLSDFIASFKVKTSQQVCLTLNSKYEALAKVLPPPKE